MSTRSIAGAICNYGKCEMLWIREGVVPRDGVRVAMCVLPSLARPTESARGLHCHAEIPSIGQDVRSLLALRAYKDALVPTRGLGQKTEQIDGKRSLTAYGSSCTT